MQVLSLRNNKVIFYTTLEKIVLVNAKEFVFREKNKTIRNFTDKCKSIFVVGGSQGVFCFYITI